MYRPLPYSISPIATMSSIGGASAALRGMRCQGTASVAAVMTMTAATPAEKLQNANCPGASAWTTSATTTTTAASRSCDIQMDRVREPVAIVPACCGPRSDIPPVLMQRV
ncbi:hypothetical protein [Microbacterium sp. SORGH_AS_0888]|uniref:hypothetical protein n=1 Tax=Microbacterium sp. SORGH_AS_0888 TaxID=3041791 RepID=UPI0027D90700|nr:hypothetical protein [Microbacterium sp. SORGH_AS_0888]